MACRLKSVKINVAKVIKYFDIELSISLMCVFVSWVGGVKSSRNIFKKAV